MGQLSPAAYDALLLEKVKLLLQAAMQSPRRRGPASTYEHFCESLDIRDEASLRAVEVLLYETTTRRPRKVRRTDSGPAASTSATWVSAFAQPRLRRLRRVASSSSEDQDDPAPVSRLFASQSETESDDEIAFVRNLEPVGTPARLMADERAVARGVEQGATTAGGGGLSPQRDDGRRLAGPDRTDGTEYTLYNQLHSIRGTPMRGVVPFEQLWNLLLTLPFPSHVDNLEAFVAALNDSPWHDAPIAAADLFDLLRAIIRCDPGVLSRADEASRARTRTSRPPAEQRSSRQQHSSWLVQPGARGFAPRSIRPAYSFGSGPGRPAPHVENRRDGIWRTTFVEHIGDGQSRDVEVDMDAGQGASEAFVDFAQHRRAERRSDAVEAADAPAPGPHVAAVRDAAAERARSRTRATAALPELAVTSASTSETSRAHSPPAVAAAGEASCPAPATARRTSASIAEAHARSQRRVVPLRGGASSDADLGVAAPSAAAELEPADGALVEQVGEPSGNMRAVVEALHRARSRRVRSTAPEAAHGEAAAAATATGGAGEPDDSLVLVPMGWEP
ncbi:uncharacterized protein RHOBADRAFT_51800 [Rhodotorula graminis WP1]|uniref:Uncharacterized protein n=1 Tax=Rhodotorula graminis (strain WP1) TaxID=578459 RepID=A0A194S8B6_RHOGW|nr:uncharacterized protein RHOBADRAFT_51800 [Rhodotorula graminis WP1]KPV76809.1 hypothetical protein RHOBADRAFT_51800 [Rhodotorula graminis WP1]